MEKINNDLLDPFRNEKIKPYPNKPPLVRKGGKRYLASTIVPRIDAYDYSMYIEPFFGGGRIYFEKKPHWMEMINDVESRITNFFYCCRNFPLEMQAWQKCLVKDQNAFLRIHKNYHDSFQLTRILEEIRDNYNAYEKEGIIESSKKILIQHAIDFFFYSNMSWRGTDSSTMTTFESDPPTESNRMRWRIFRPLGWIGDRMRRTQVLNYDFTKIFKLGLNYKNHSRIWYLDPPYLDTEAYENPFPLEKYLELNECLKQIPQTDYFIISLNQHYKYNEIFDWCEFEEVTTRYTYAGNREGGKEVKEWLITPPWKPKMKVKQKLDRFFEPKYTMDLQDQFF